MLDDIIVWWVSDERFDVMPNASNTSRVVDAIGGTDVTGERAVIALQGPHGPGPARRARVPTLVDRRRVAEVEWEGVPVVVSGTGYTGEDGVEVAVPAGSAGAFWDAVLAAGFEPAGLGARDTLRLEAGLPLHGHELGPGITPLQAGLGWVIGWKKGPFRGRAALEAERERGVARRLRGLLVEGRRPPRDGSPVLVDGEPAGEVTSGNFSPMLGQGIALAFLPPDVEEGAAVEVDLRGTHLPAKVVPTPFV